VVKPTPAPTLDELATHPERVRELPSEVARDRLLRLAPLQEALRLQALSAQADGNGAAGGPTGPGEAEAADILTLEEAAQLLRTSPDTLYRKWKKLPFAFKDPLDGKIKFSRSGVERYLKSRVGKNPS